jgi:hypothetical protein
VYFSPKLFFLQARFLELIDQRADPSTVRHRQQTSRRIFRSPFANNLSNRLAADNLRRTSRSTEPSGTYAWSKKEVRRQRAEERNDHMLLVTTVACCCAGALYGVLLSTSTLWSDHGWLPLRDIRPARRGAYRLRDQYDAWHAQIDPGSHQRRHRAAARADYLAM